MRYITFLILLGASLLGACTDMGYNQPVYIISDTSLEEEQKESQKDEEFGVY
ncbi:MAG: hypothetical protein HYX48_07940 [Chlamydiales bacterium]|nr:hypothetical protein [Chlamydiales bacterium]